MSVKRSKNLGVTVGKTSPEGRTDTFDYLPTSRWVSAHAILNYTGVWYGIDEYHPYHNYQTWNMA